jgi:hypothetical protein
MPRMNILNTVEVRLSTRRGLGTAGMGVWARGDHAAGPLRSKSCFSGFEVSRA